MKDVNARQWANLKSRLVRRGLLNEVFLEAPAGVRPRLRRYPRSSRSRYEPLLFDNLLRDLAEHVDRAMDFRREWASLEVQAVKASTEYLLFLEQSEIDLKLDELRLRAKQKEIVAKEQRKASELFGTNSDIAKGFAKIAEGTASQFQQEIQDTRDEMLLIEKRHRVISAFQADYFDRTNQAGNAHNYGQRAKWVKEIAQMDIDAAAEKAIAIYFGFAMLFGRSPPELPALSDVQFVDRLAIWTRRVIEEVGIEAQSEAEVDLVIPLRQPSEKGREPLVSEAAWTNALNKTGDGKTPFLIEFELQGLMYDLKNVRLRRLGLAYGTRVSIGSTDIDKAATHEAYARYRAKVTTPTQKRADGGEYRRPPVILGNMSVYGAPLSYTEGTECMNIDPRGRWKIEVAPVPTSKGIEVKNPSIGMYEYPWVDLKIFLRVRASQR